MNRSIRKRLEALERGGSDDERVAKLLRDRLEEWKRQDEARGIKWPTLGDSYRDDYEASKPANWSELSTTERTDHWIRFTLDYQPSL